MQFTFYLLLLGFFFTGTKCIPLFELSREKENVDEDYIINCNNQSLTLYYESDNATYIGPDFVVNPLLLCLRLQGDGVRAISPLAFDKLPNLTYLELSNNDWREQEMLYEGGHKTLKTLILSNVWSDENLFILPKIIYINASYPSLEKLVFRNNLADIIVGFKGADLPKLSYVDFSHNKILKFHTNGEKLHENEGFSWLRNKPLKYLKLDNNFLWNLSLTNMNELEFLSINNNLLLNFDLQNLNKLKVFSASGNKIGRLSYDAFSGVPEIEELNLADNRISDFDGEIVDFMTKLRNLSLATNLLTGAPAIGNAPNLQYYSLRCNKIRKLGSNCFNRMPNLKYLHLDNNEIDEINPNTFKHLEKLETLSLGRNKLINLPAEWMLKLQNLRFLHFEENQFTNLEALQLNNSLSLMQVFLQNNPLQYFLNSSVPENVKIELVTLSIVPNCTKFRRLP